MRRALGAITLLVVVLACDGSPAEPSFDYAAFVGDWRLLPEPEFGCWPEGADFWLRVSHEDAERAGGDPSGVLNVSSSWSFDPDFAQSYSLTGNFNLAADTFTLDLWRLGVRSQFSGRIESPNRIVGRWTAPRNFLSAFHGCDAQAVATH